MTFLIKYVTLGKQKFIYIFIRCVIIIYYILDAKYSQYCVPSAHLEYIFCIIVYKLFKRGVASVTRVCLAQALPYSHCNHAFPYYSSKKPFT